MGIQSKPLQITDPSVRDLIRYVNALVEQDNQTLSRDNHIHTDLQSALDYAIPYFKEKIADNEDRPHFEDRLRLAVQLKYQLERDYGQHW